MNFIANTKKSNRILNRSCISSFKTNNNSIHWHIDGWEHHSLNQPLHCTCVIAYSDINNGTYVAPESIKLLTRLFYENKFKFHAETVMDFSPLTNYIINKCNDIRQIKLKKGDMLIMHPFLLHSGNNNKFSSIRLLTNFHLYKVIDFKNPKSLIEKKYITI